MPRSRFLASRRCTAGKGTDSFSRDRGTCGLERGWLGYRFTSLLVPSSLLLFLVAHPLMRLRVTFFACPKKVTKERAPEAHAPSGFPPTALSLRGPSTGILPDDGLAGLPAGHPGSCGARAIPRSGGRGRRRLRGRARRFVLANRWIFLPVRSRVGVSRNLGTWNKAKRSLFPQSQVPRPAPLPFAACGEFLPPLAAGKMTAPNHNPLF